MALSEFYKDMLMQTHEPTPQRMKRETYRLREVGLITAWIFADLLLGLLMLFLLVAPSLNLFLFVSLHPILTIIITLSIGLFLLMTIGWVIISHRLDEKQKKTAEIAETIKISGDKTVPAYLLSDVQISEDRTGSLPTEYDRMLQSNLIKAWVQKDAKLKSAIKLLLIGDQSAQAERISSVEIEHFKELISILEKRIYTLESQKKQDNKLLEWTTAFYNIAYIIVSVPTILAFGYALYTIFHH